MPLLLPDDASALLDSDSDLEEELLALPTWRLAVWEVLQRQAISACALGTKLVAVLTGTLTRAFAAEFMSSRARRLRSTSNLQQACIVLLCARTAPNGSGAISL
jgi:hypothetical protein